MSKKRSGDNRKQKSLNSPSRISRRDFVNGSLVGAGATLLGAAGPGYARQSAQAAATSDTWTGYGGVGDYAISNGNVATVRDAAHLIRDGKTADLSRDATDTGEIYDMVIIGGGFSGIGAAYQFHKSSDETKQCLVLENHPIYGGEAKQNEFDVDGYRLYGPQGSNDFAPPDRNSDSLIAQIYRDANIPFEYEFVAPGSGNSKVRAPREHFYGIYWEEERYDTGYFLGDDVEHPWVVNPRKDKLARMPWSDDFKAELNRAFADVEEYYTGEDLDRWLDSMSYKQLLEDVMGFSSKVTDYFDPILAISMGGVGADAYSAYSAKLLDMPGTNVHYTFEHGAETSHSFPGGNTGLMRHIVKYLIDDSIESGDSFEEILVNPIRFDSLDRPDNRVRIRLNATAIDISHAGAAEDADHVNVTYYEGGQVKKVRAKSVVVSIGGWVARNIVSDMPEYIADAYSQFYHSPILVVNVALRNWRFLDKLGDQ
jgi:spermidine dehydrogenase